MTGLVEEYDYKHLEQKLNINDDYVLEYTFGDDRMCGSLMYGVCLYDSIHDCRIGLRCDCPIQDGRPSFFTSEVILIIKHIYNYKHRAHTFQQILSLIHIICPIDKHMLDKILVECGIDRESYNKLDKINIWPNHEKVVNPDLGDESELEQCSIIGYLYLGAHPATLNQVFPFPKECMDKFDNKSDEDENTNPSHDSDNSNDETKNEVNNKVLYFNEYFIKCVDEECSMIEYKGKKYKMIEYDGWQCINHETYGYMITGYECNRGIRNSFWNDEQYMHIITMLKILEEKM
jgi:hypothetical protein